MLASLPALPPRNTHILWSPISTGSTDQDDGGPPSPTSPHQLQQQTRRSAHGSHHRRTKLDQLNADEQFLRSRKYNVRRFGSTWIRPAGVAKTLQAMNDEEYERLEQESNARREAALAEEQAAADAMARQVAMQVDGGEMERDLDDDVPEAGADVDQDDNELGDRDDEGEEMGAAERDLDDDIPETGSYEHTETDVEDLTSEDEHFTPSNRSPRISREGTNRPGQSPAVVQNTQLHMAVPPSAPRLSFGSLHSGSADSSMLMFSSPIAARSSRPRGYGTPRRGPDSTRRENTRPSSDE